MTDTPMRAREIVEATTSGGMSAVEAVQACLDAVLAREDEIGAWAHLDGDLALAQARVLDETTVRGPLHGVPVGVKDIVDTVDQPTGYGSALYTGHRPASDATLVRRLRDAGAIILGKTVTTEFALFQPGPTANPHDLSRTPGGSSSGSAAATACGMVPVAVGTQTAASIVRPASFCGVYGVKPTFGRIPTDGVRPIAASLDTMGALGADLDDVALLLGVMADNVEGFAPVDVDRPTIGFCRTPQWDALDATTRDALEGAASTLSEHTEVREVALPAVFDGLAEAQTVIMAAEACVTFATDLRDHADQLSERLREYLGAAAELAAGNAAARATVERSRDELAAVFRPVDVLLVPAVVGEAPDRATTGDPLPCRMWTQLGLPSVAVPGLRGPEGLPLGVQVVAPFGRDDQALGVSRFVGQVLAA